LFFLSENVDESLIDFAQPDLDLQIWNKNSHSHYSLAPSVEAAIMKFIGSYPSGDILAGAMELRVIGSITTNQYLEDTDIDVHIVPKDPTLWDEKKVWGVKRWFDSNREKQQAFISKHPIEIFIQVNSAQDLLSPGVYNINTKQWLKGPKVVPEDYNPYEDFSDIATELKSSVGAADLFIGELRRDVIDFETIQKAVNSMSSENKQKFLVVLEDKLQEIEDDIQNLYRKRKEWVDTRRGSSRPETPEQALQDIELAKKWKNTDALFKFINRYKYLSVISDLQKVVKDDEDVSPEDVNVIKNIIGA